MTLTTIVYSSTNGDQYKEIWTQMLLAEAAEMIFWNPMSGSEGSNSPIIVRTDLVAQAGGQVKIDMFAQLSGAGVSGETALSGSEEAMSFYQLPVTIGSYANAMAFHKLSQQHTIHSLRETGRRASAEWLAAKIDNAIFDILDAQTTNRIYGGTATAKNTLTGADLMSTEVIDRAAAKARDELVKPLNVGGGQYYLMVISNHQAWALRKDPVWIAAQQTANIRGSQNPIFSGAMGEWNGVVVYVNNRVERGTNAGNPATVSYAIAHLVGSNAVGFAWAEYPTMIEEIRDYKRVYGIGAEAMYGVAAAVFNSQPIGHIPVMTATADPNA